jgi:hypothetical protein
LVLVLARQTRHILNCITHLKICKLYPIGIYLLMHLCSASILRFAITVEKRNIVIIHLIEVFVFMTVLHVIPSMYVVTVLSHTNFVLSIKGFDLNRCNSSLTNSTSAIVDKYFSLHTNYHFVTASFLLPLLSKNLLRR